MNEIKFNWLSYNTDFKDPKAGTKMKTDCYKNIPKSDDINKTRIQLFDCGYRVTKDTLDYSNWNQCIYKDIDYKYYYWSDEENKISPEVLYYNVVNKLIEMCPDNFMDAEISRSGIDFHLFFGFDCERSELSRDFYNDYVNDIIKKCFNELGYKYIFDYPKVFDSCTNSIYQLCYVTKNKWIHNYRFTGNISLKPVKKETNIEKSNNIINKKQDVFFIGKREVKEVEYIEHILRWRLFNSLSRIFLDPLKLKEEWEYCANLIPEVNGHTKEYYRNCPYTINDWNDILKGDEYIDIVLLKKFGYDVYVKNKLDFKLNF